MVRKGLLDSVIVSDTERSQCAVERHSLSVGATPTRQLSLQPVAIRAVVKVTKPPKPSV